ncbi:MAG TPA: tetratricopeptide repeat protein, partial [bacterium]|nr:tetratricopeptide repeat protein [bacterium]
MLMKKSILTVKRIYKSLILHPSSFILHITLCLLPYAFCLFLFSCAYFNTFYLTKKNFNDGEFQRLREKGKLNTKAKTSYNDAILRGSEILDKYRTSKYVDDSLYYIGMSYYHLEQFIDARTKFDELIRAFPESEFVPSATYYKAKSLIELGQNEEARDMLLELMDSDKPTVTGLAALAITEESFKIGDWDELFNSSQKVIDIEPDKEVLYKAIYYKGESLYQLEQYEECVETLSELRDKKIESELRFRVNSRIALSEAKLGKYDEAMLYLGNMENKGEFSIYAPRIRLEIGSIHEIQGDDELAIDTYLKMAGDYPDSLAAKEAWYRIGKIRIKDLSKADEAKEAFEMVKKGKAKTNAFWTVEAELKSAQIDSMNARFEEIKKIKDDNEALARVRFSLAEIYSYSFDRADSALTQYKLIIAESPDSEFAIKSEYFLGLNELQSSEKFSEESDKALMMEIIEKYPESEFTQELKVYLGIIEKSAEIKALLVAEHSRLSGQDPEVYIPLYQEVVDNFQKTKSAYQARFNIAYFYEHDVGDRDKAFELYEELADETPTVN